MKQAHTLIHYQGNSSLIDTNHFKKSVIWGEYTGKFFKKFFCLKKNMVLAVSLFSSLFISNLNNYWLDNYHRVLWGSLPFVFYVEVTFERELFKPVGPLRINKISLVWNISGLSKKKKSPNLKERHMSKVNCCLIQKVWQYIWKQLNNVEFVSNGVTALITPDFFKQWHLTIFGP